MPLPMSKNQLKKLGIRLASLDDVAEEDFEQLGLVLNAYAASLDNATPRIADATRSVPVSRVKNTGTLREKLRRGGNLASIQDLAGARIVVSSRDTQDLAVAQLVAEFRDAAKPPAVKDRRSDPSAGYRAVHLTVFPDGIPIEVQIRTRFQHRWAELFEKYADLVGRDVRYGGQAFSGTNFPRDEVPELVLAAANRVGDAMQGLSEAVATFEDEPARIRGQTVSWPSAANRVLLSTAFLLVEKNLGALESAIRTTRRP